MLRSFPHGFLRVVVRHKGLALPSVLAPPFSLYLFEGDNNLFSDMVRRSAVPLEGSLVPLYTPGTECSLQQWSHLRDCFIRETS